MRNNILPPVKRGDTWTFTFSWKNQNTPIDLTDCTVLIEAIKEQQLHIDKLDKDIEQLKLKG
jgi:hypothetical protein